jgi:hypothetical protein
MTNARLTASLPASAGRRRRLLAGRPQLLLVLAALVAAVVAGFLVSRGNAEIGLFAGLAIPLAVVVLQYPLAGLMVWMVAMPFLGAIGGEGQAGPLFWLLYRLGIPAILLIAALDRSSHSERGAFRIGVIDVALVLFLVVGAVNVVLLADGTRNLISYYDKLVVPITVFWVVRVLEPSPAELRRLIPIAIWSVLTQAIIGAMSWVAPQFLPSEWLGREGERTIGTLGGPGPYTIGIVFFSLLLVYWAMQSSSAARRRILFGIVLAGQGAVLLSLSRGSWVGAAAAFGGLILVYPRQVRWAVIVGVAVVALLFVGPLSGALDTVTERLGTVDTVDARIITNDAAVRMVGDRPLLGFGWGNFDLFDESYKQPVGDVPLRLGGSAHNTYLNLAVEFGLIGTILYVAPVLILLVLTLRRRRILSRQPWRWQLVVVLWLALLDQFLVNNFAEMIHSSEWATSIWWITVALIVVALFQWRDEPLPIPQSGAWDQRRR